MTPMHSPPAFARLRRYEAPYRGIAAVMDAVRLSVGELRHSVRHDEIYSIGIDVTRDDPRTNSHICWKQGLVNAYGLTAELLDFDNLLVFRSVSEHLDGPMPANDDGIEDFKLFLNVHVAGRGILRVESTSHPIVPGDAYILNPNCVHEWTRSDSSHHNHAVSFTLASRFVPGLLGGAGFGPVQPALERADVDE